VSRPLLAAIPAHGDRVCLREFPAYADRHDHGTVIGVGRDGLGIVKALVQWDDDPEGMETGWCDLAALDTRCPTRTLPTPHAPPEARR
jgi:hypothetical protein